MNDEIPDLNLEKPKLTILQKISLKLAEKKLQKISKLPSEQQQKEINKQIDKISQKDRKELETRIWNMTDIFNITDDNGQEITQEWLEIQPTDQLTNLLKELMHKMHEITRNKGEKDEN